MRPNESFVGQPVRSLQTMLRVISQRYTELPTLIPDGIYGPQTMTAVASFQRRFHIPVTGVVDLPTWNEIVLQYNPARTHQVSAQPIQIILNPDKVIRAGEFNRFLYLAQAMLTVLSLDCASIPPVPVNGILDEATVAGLRAFQDASSLPATGELDKITWKHLSLQFTLNANRARQDTPNTKA